MIYFAMPVAGTGHGLRRFGLWLALLQQRLDRSCRATCAFLPMARKSFRYASATARNLLILSTSGISSMTDVDSNEMAFKIAASMALKNAASKCKPVILEPIMKVEVVIPEDYLGDIMGDITSRRGRVEGMEARGNTQMVKAMVPLSEMFGYATSLRSNTQ